LPRTEYDHESVPENSEELYWPRHSISLYLVQRNNFCGSISSGDPNSQVTDFNKELLPTAGAPIMQTII